MHVHTHIYRIAENNAGINNGKLGFLNFLENKSLANGQTMAKRISKFEGENLGDLPTIH